MLFKKYEVSLNIVHDRITVREGADTLDLYVNADPAHVIAGMNRAVEALKGITVETPDEEITKAALDFAGSIFGTEQAAALLEFYHGSGSSVISICGKYFNERLGKKITEAQKARK